MKTRKNLLFITGLFLVSVVYIAMTAGSTQFDVYLLVLLFAGLVSIPFLIRNKPIDWFEPVYLYSTFYFLTFGMRAIYLVLTPEAEGRPAVDISGVFITTILYAIVGYLAFLIGYYSWFAPRLCRRLRPIAKINTSKIHFLIYVTYPLGIIGKLMLIAKGWHLSYQCQEFAQDIPAYFGVIGYTYFTSVFGFVVALILLFSREKKGGLAFYFWCIIVPSEILWVLLAGSKHGFFPLLFIPLAACNYARTRIKLKSFIIPLLIFIFVVFPFVGAYRNSVLFGDFKLTLATAGSDFGEMLGRTYTTLKEDLSTDFFGNTIGQFMDRFNAIDAFSYVVVNTPDPVEFQYGRTIIGALAVFVPTFIWPNKGDYLRESMYLVPVLFGGPYGPSHAGLAISFVAELYWNFWVVGIIVGMFLMGIFTRFFYLYFVKKDNIMSTAIYISQFGYLIFVEGWIFYTYQNIIKQIIIFLFFLAILNGGHLFSKRAT